MKHLRFLLTLLAVGAVLVPLPVVACSCSWIYPPGTPLLSSGAPVPTPEEFAGQAFLFSGTVESIRAIPTGNPATDKWFANGSATVLRIDSVWRGQLPFETITVYTPFPGGACGYPFKVGRCYLVFAEVEEDGMLRTGICTRTSSWENAGDLLPYVSLFLGPPQPSFHELLEGSE